MFGRFTLFPLTLEIGSPLSFFTLKKDCHFPLSHFREVHSLPSHTGDRFLLSPLSLKKDSHSLLSHFRKVRSLVSHWRQVSPFPSSLRLLSPTLISPVTGGRKAKLINQVTISPSHLLSHGRTSQDVRRAVIWPAMSSRNTW